MSLFCFWLQLVPSVFLATWASFLLMATFHSSYSKISAFKSVRAWPWKINICSFVWRACWRCCSFFVPFDYNFSRSTLHLTSLFMNYTLSWTKFPQFPCYHQNNWAPLCHHKSFTMKFSTYYSLFLYTLNPHIIAFSPLSLAHTNSVEPVSQLELTLFPRPCLLTWLIILPSQSIIFSWHLIHRYDSTDLAFMSPFPKISTISCQSLF